MNYVRTLFLCLLKAIRIGYGNTWPRERERERESQSQSIDLVSVGGDGKGEEEFLRDPFNRCLGRWLSVGRV